MIQDPQAQVNSMEGVAVTKHAEFLDPEVSPPPRGVELNVLTVGGISIEAQWTDDAHKRGFIGWYPLISVPKWARERIHALYTASTKPGIDRP